MSKTKEQQEIGDSALVERVSEIANKEIRATIELLLHLNELDKRKLFLELGYSSLFSYLVTRVKYSEGAAYRRIAAARLARQYPQLYRYLYAREVSLSNLSLVSGFCLKEGVEREQVIELLEGIRGKSKSEVNALLARYKPVSVPRERIEPVLIEKKSKGASESAPQLVLAEVKGKEVGNESGESASTVSETTVEASLLSPKNSEECYRLSFSIGAQSKSKLERVQSLIGGPGAKSLESVFGVLLETYLEKHCPERRLVRREQRLARQRRAGASNTAPRKSSPSRYIPARLRDEVFLRDGFRCTYVSPDGVRCWERTCLEIDHVEPFSLGGRHRLDNLRLLCSAHNKHAAVKIFGKKFIEQKVKG